MRFCLGSSLTPHEQEVQRELVSIADAILFGFKLEDAAGDDAPFRVSIADAIMFGFKRITDDAPPVSCGRFNR